MVYKVKCVYILYTYFNNAMSSIIYNDDDDLVYISLHKN